MSERYVTVDVVYRARTARAVLVRKNHKSPDVWIPRSCLQHATDKAVDACNENDDLHMMAMEWILQKNGLL